MIGKTVARYKISERLGAGGMGVVFKAIDQLLARHVALKFLPEELAADPDAMRRFQHEARAACALNHPNICTIYDIGEFEGQSYIVMELLEGEPLDRLTVKGALPLAQMLTISIDVMDALQCAHERGVIHRDIKAANIFITKEGRAKILDFGLAKFSASATSDLSNAVTVQALTVTGAVMGTVCYMSPEQVLGKELDARTDLFSFAVVLYEMATGARPFDGKTWTATANDIVNRKLPTPLTYNSKLPGRLIDILDTALEKDRNARYQTASNFRQDLIALRREIEAGISAPGDGAGAMSATSIAVLPFADLTPQKDHDYLCDGLAEELINRLSQLSGIRVASRTSAFSLKGKEMDLHETAAKLDVNTILEGSVRKSGDRLRISVQLVDVGKDVQLWSEKFDRQLEDVFAVQDDIAESVAKQLKLALTAHSGIRIRRRYADNVEAYNLYLKGLYFWNRRFEGQVGKAIEAFEAVIQSDPSHALAWAGIADSYTQLAAYSILPPKVAFVKARDAAEKAIELDDTLPETHCSKAVVDLWFRWDYLNAEQGFRRAIELNPRFGLARHYLSICLSYGGRFKEAIEEIQYAQKLEPLSHIINGTAALVLYYARRYDEALDECRKVLEIEPHALLPIFVTGAAQVGKRNWAEAIAAFEHASKLTGDRAFWYGVVGYGHSAAGNREQALQIVEALKLRMSAGEEYVDPILLAWIFGGLGDADNAFYWFDRAAEEGSCELMLTKILPAVDPVRSDPRLNGLLQRIGLPV